MTHPTLPPILSYGSVISGNKPDRPNPDAPPAQSRRYLGVLKVFIGACTLNEGDGFIAVLEVGVSPDGIPFWMNQAVPALKRNSPLLGTMALLVPDDVVALVFFARGDDGRWIAANVMCPNDHILPLMLYGERLLTDRSIPLRCEGSLAARNNLESFHSSPRSSHN